MDDERLLRVQKYILRESLKYLDFLKKNLKKSPDNKTLKQHVQKKEDEIRELKDRIDELKKKVRNVKTINGTMPVNTKGNKVISGKKLSDLGININENISSQDEKKSYIGGKHFKQNILNSEYIIFKKDGYINIIGNFTAEWIKDNYENLNSPLINNSGFRGIKLWNNLKTGTTTLSGMDVKVDVSGDGIKLKGNVDALEHHNNPMEDDKHIQDNKDDSDEKDYSGLDVLPDMSNLNTGAEKIKPLKVRERKNPKPSLIQKFKNLSFKKKALIVAGIIVAVGVGVFVIGPQIMDAINNAINPENVNTINQVNDLVSNVPVDSSAINIDYSSIGENHTVFTNAYDAVNNTNGVISNEWFNNNPVDVFNTATNSYMGLTPEQLNDPAFMAELTKDPNNAVLLGNSISDPSGFVGLDEVVKSGMMK